MKNWKCKIILFLLAIVLMSEIWGKVSIEMVQAARNVDFNAKISELRNKYPNGKYWNHYVSKASENGDALWSRNDTSFSESVTNHPCATHNLGTTASVGQYDCNFYGGIQCCGFAKKIYREIYGVEYNAGSLTTNYTEVQVGDLIVIEGGNHWAFVIAKNDNKAKLVEANREGNCKIVWDREIDLANCGFKDARHKPSDVNFISDTTKPAVSNVKVSKVTTDGYTVTGKVSDNVGVTRVSLGFWGPGESWEDGTWQDISFSNGTFSYYIQFSKVKCNKSGGVKRGIYCADVYAFDAAGNSNDWDSSKNCSRIEVTNTLFDKTKPTVTKVEITNNTNGQFIIKGTATDNDAVASFIFDAQSSNSTIKSKTAQASNGQATATFKASELSSIYKNGKVITVNVYAVDKAGNKSDKKSINVTLKYDTQNPVVAVLSATSQTAGKFTVNATATDDTNVKSLTIKIWGPEQSEKSGAKEIQCAADSYKGTFSISDFNNTSGGIFTIKVEAVDAYGKKSSAKTTTVNVSVVHSHTFSSTWEYDSSCHFKRCSCGVLNREPHSIEDIIVKEPSYTEKGYKYQSCKVCGYKSVQVEIPKLQISENDSIPQGPSTWQGKTGTRGFVYRLYNVALCREADASGLNDWINKLNRKEKTATEVAYGFFFSKEFKDKNYNDAQYVKFLYRTMFGREADPDGFIYWMTALENGMSREYVYKGFAESAEFTNLCKTYHVNRGSIKLKAYRDQNAGATGFVARLYTKMLGRGYDEAGLEYWCKMYLTKKKSLENIAADGFLHSKELKNQNLSDEEFVRRMYLTFLNREPDAEGLTYWVNRLRTGKDTRDSLVYGFTRSTEFKQLKKSYGLK